MKFQQCKQVGYGQFNITMTCPECGNEITVHRTGHPWELHQDDCVLSSRTLWLEKMCEDCECDSCGHTEETTHTCTCEDL